MTTPNASLHRGITAQARDLLRTHAHLTSEDIGEVLASATAGDLARMRRQGNLLGLRFAHIGYLYPAFQVDDDRRRVSPLVTQVNRILLSGMSVENAIIWWYAENDNLHRCPYLKLGEPDALVESARSLNQ